MKVIFNKDFTTEDGIVIKRGEVFDFVERSLDENDNIKYHISSTRFAAPDSSKPGVRVFGTDVVAGMDIVDELLYEKIMAIPRCNCSTISDDCK